MSVIDRQDAHDEVDTSRDISLPLAPREESFTSRLRHLSVTARVGTWLGVAFAVALVTGVYSHYSQSFTPWFPLVVTSWAFRVNQGLHTLSGIAAVPLLLVKLWVVYPKLFAKIPWPPSRRMALTIAERASIVVLVSAAAFELFTGLANIAHWYPWSFSFRSTHYAVGLVAFGALVLHIAIKMPLIQQGWAEKPSRDRGVVDGPARRAGDDATPPSVVSRRTLLNLTWGATGLAVLATAGATVPFLRKISVFAVRTGEGPQGMPINRTASEAGVTRAAVAPAVWTMTLSHAGEDTTLTLDDLQAMEQVTHTLPMACVEGWSASAEWTGVPLRALMAAAGAPPGSDVRVVSAQTRGAFSRTLMPAEFADDERTLVALRINGEVLSLDHGFPARIIAPGRPGVLQTKWITALETVGTPA